MKLHLNEQLILTAWSRGLAGASQRLARRAWWVLQDRSKVRSSVTGGGAWANAVEAHKWVVNYHAMGLVGLVDAPRTGRPMLHAQAVQGVQEKLNDLKQSQLDGVNGLKSVQLRDLTRQEREALWRQSRLKGHSVVRDRYGQTVPLVVPYELRDVLAVVLTKHLKILAFFENSDDHWSGLAGSWIGVPNVKRDQLSDDKRNRSSLMSALALDVQEAKTKGKTDTRANWMVARALDHIEQVASQHPQKISVAVIFDLDAPTPFIDLLQTLRSKRLWALQNPQIPGLLKQLHIYPFEKKWGLAVQTILAIHLAGVGGNVLAEFQDLLTLKRQGQFCWVRGFEEG
jgi:hypothetical protein